MNPLNHPPIETRQASELLVEMIKRIPQFFPDWKPENQVPDDFAGIMDLADDTRDAGMAMLKLAAYLGEIIADQVNRIPEKNFLAFLTFIGIDLSPPKSARTPLTFFLSDRAPNDGFVPIGTRVGAINRDDVIFETEDDLLVTRAALLGAYSIDLQKDRYLDLSSVVKVPGTAAMEVFGDSNSPPIWLPNEHAIYLGHDTLFSKSNEARGKLTIVFSLASGHALPELNWEYSTADGWRTMNVATASTPTHYILETPDIAKMTVGGWDDTGTAIERLSYWVRAKTTDPKPLTIKSVEVSVDINNKPVPEYLAYFNNFEVDITKDFFPFGERPKFNDTCYIACQPAFAHPTTTTILQVELSGAIVTQVDIGLDWEYWDGSSWQIIGHTTQIGVSAEAPIGEFNFSDTSNAFTQGGTIQFSTPNVKERGQNGVKDYWIRIRIVDGDYGKEASYQITANQELKDNLRTIETDETRYQSIIDLLNQYGLVNSYQYIEATFDPPSIKTLSLSYSLTTTAGFNVGLTNNGYVYREVLSSTEFQPFYNWEDIHPSLYLEFKSATTVPGTPLSLYIQFVPPKYGVRNLENAIGTGAPPVVIWTYWNGIKWMRLPAEDETVNFTSSGLLRFIVPDDAVDRYLFGKKRLWIKASLESGGYSVPPKLEGLSLNTVWASHGISFKDQILGSSNGDPDQTFQYTKTPVLLGQIVEVREPTPPADAELARIVAVEGEEAIRTVKDAAGNITEVWIRWQAVGSLSLSTASDRHYVLDRVTGKLMFGDGVQGQIPPAGKTNIVAKVYRAGGGKEGLCEKLSLTELKTTLPLIDKVTNYQPTAGGTDQEDIDRVVMSGPQRIKSRDRAVTVEDFEWLARDVTSEVAKSRCLPLTKSESLIGANQQGNDPGWITVMIVPQGEEDRPLPSEQLINLVKRYLIDRALATLGKQIDVIGPRYVPIDVTAEIIPRHIKEAKSVEKQVFDDLRTFLHPLSGGPDGGGWEFGRTIYQSEIGAVVQGAEGVDRIRNLTIRKSGAAVPRDRIIIGRDDLPASGHHTIVATGA